jgi:hypothetical protein
MTLYHLKVKEIFKIEENILNQIKDQICNNYNVQLYDRFNNKGLLQKSVFENVFNLKFIGYCIPYANISKKMTNDTNYNTLFKNLQNKEQGLKEKAANLVFINGDVMIDSFMNDNYLVPRPLLRLVHYENL